MVEVKINLTIKKVISLHESEIFSLEETKEYLNQFKKKDMVNYIIEENIINPNEDENEGVEDYEDEEDKDEVEEYEDKDEILDDDEDEDKDDLSDFE